MTNPHRATKRAIGPDGHPFYIFGSGVVSGVLAAIGVIQFLVLPHYIQKTAVPAFVREGGGVIVSQSEYDGFRQLVGQKIDIVRIFQAQIDSLRSEIAYLRAVRVYIDPDRAGTRGSQPAFEPRFVHGVVQSPSRTPIADAQVNVRGGSQMYTTSSGEFFVRARRGDVLVVRTNADTVEVPIAEQDFGEPKVITMGR